MTRADTDVQRALQSYIDSLRVPGGDLAFIQGVGTAELPPDDTGLMPYVVVSGAEAALTSSSNVSKYYTVTINCALFDVTKNATEDSMRVLKEALIPVLERPSFLTAYVEEGINTEIYDAAEVDEGLEELGSHIWGSTLTLNFFTFSPR